MHDFVLVSRSVVSYKVWKQEVTGSDRQLQNNFSFYQA